MAGDGALLPPSRRMLAGAVLALGNFMVVLDLTIANVSIPHISGNLGITNEQGTWIITSYAVAEAICVPLTGWLSQRFGAVRLFVMSLVGFGLFSLLCGLSMTLEMLVLCRIGQGICGAPIMPMSQTLMVRVFTVEGRAKAMAAWAMTVTLGPALGPVLGGVISDQISWHWIFLINVPIAVLLAVGVIALLSEVETARRKVPIDRIGLALTVLWIGSLQLMLDTGHNRDWFNDPFIMALAIIAGLGFIVFVIWELTEDHPIVDLRVFRHRGFTLSVAIMMLGFGAFFAGTVVVPQWLQTSLGYTATTAGMVAAVHAYVAVLVSFPAAKLMPRVDLRLMIGFGLFWMIVSMGMRAFWTSDGDFWSYGLVMVIQGFGIPFMMVSLTTLALSTVDPDEVASAAGLNSFARTVSLAVASSLSMTVWGDSERVAGTEIAAHLQPEQVEATLGGMGFGTEQIREFLAAMAEKEAVGLAINHLFSVTTGVMMLAMVLVFLMPKPERITGPGAAH
ncbi:MAG: DHA2 family efflux MFS transporter permease subunit [Novosphingobium sp.]|nr:DHA2 family efflux MFS transporter permease subunit [Novosphingobium sp.]